MTPAERLPRRRPIGAMVLTMNPGRALLEVRAARHAIAPLLAPDVDWESLTSTYRAAVRTPEGDFTAYVHHSGPTTRTGEVSFFGREFDRITVPMGDDPEGDSLDDPVMIVTLADATLTAVEGELAAFVNAVVRPSLGGTGDHVVVETGHAPLGVDDMMLALGAFGAASDYVEAATPFYPANLDGHEPGCRYLRDGRGEADADFRATFRDLDARLPAIIRVDTQESAAGGRVRISPEFVVPRSDDERCPVARPMDAARALSAALALPAAQGDRA
jgi:hypothetical protein